MSSGSDKQPSGLSLEIGALPEKAASSYAAAVGQRLKSVRKAINLSQDELASQSGVSYSVLQKYEIGRSVPGGEAIAGFVRCGINGNWLLTGDGPMLMAELCLASEQNNPEPALINQGALAALLQGAIGLVKEGMPVDRAARLAAETYQRALESGEITPTGIGKGKHGQAA